MTLKICINKRQIYSIIHNYFLTKIAVIGLGYVGLPLARLFATKYPVVGFDVNRIHVDDLMQGIDLVVLAVAHKAFEKTDFSNLLKTGSVVYRVK